MQAIICNKAHPDLGSTTIPLPILDKEYGRCMELLEQMQIGNAAANDCYICQRRFKIVGKRRRNFVVFRRGGNRN